MASTSSCFRRTDFNLTSDNFTLMLSPNMWQQELSFPNMSNFMHVHGSRDGVQISGCLRDACLKRLNINLQYESELSL